VEEEQVSAPSGAVGSTAGGRAITFCSAHELVRRGPAFARTPGGWSAGDRVALIGDVSVDLLAAFVTLRARGLCPVPLDSSFSLEETAFALNDSRAREVVIDRDHAALAEQLRPLTPYVESWTVLHPGPAVAPVAGAAVRLGEPCGSLHYSTVPTGRPVGCSVPDPVASDAGRRDLGALLGDRTMSSGDVVLLATSISDPAAAQLCIAAVEEGAFLLLGHGAGAPDLLSAIDEHRPTIVHLSPATAIALADAHRAGAVSVWTPATALITAPGCPPSVTRGLIEAWGPVLRLVRLGPFVGPDLA
jgi:non-ribosomal peptide synthetase component F